MLFIRYAAGDEGLWSAYLHFSKMDVKTMIADLAYNFLHMASVMKKKRLVTSLRLKVMEGGHKNKQPNH